MAVAVGADVNDEADVEALLALADGLAYSAILRLRMSFAWSKGASMAFFGHTPRQQAAADALVRVYAALAVFNVRRALGAVLYAHPAAYASPRCGRRRGRRSASPSCRRGSRCPCRGSLWRREAGQLVALEVVEGDNDVRVGYGAAYLGLLHVFAALDGYPGLVVPLEAVGDNGVDAVWKGFQPLA